MLEKIKYNILSHIYAVYIRIIKRVLTNELSQRIKSLVPFLPFGKDFLNWISKNRGNLLADSFKNKKDLFAYTYRKNIWGSEESFSGPGSTLEYTRNIREELPLLFRHLGVTKLLDAPCGDFNWLRHMERDPSMIYIGGDIVGEMVKRNKALYGDNHTIFKIIDIRVDPLPQADLWLCRDILFHFSFDDIALTLNNFFKSGIPYLLTSSHTECRENIDIPTGSCRQLNLELPPFSFCQPIKYVDDWMEGFPVRKLCLWESPILQEFLKGNSYFALKNRTGEV